MTSSECVKEGEYACACNEIDFRNTPSSLRPLHPYRQHEAGAAAAPTKFLNSTRALARA